VLESYQLVVWIKEIRMYYPPAVYQKARQLEQLLLRLEAGEPLDQLCAELELDVSPERVTRLKAKYEAGGRAWEALLDGRFGHAQHVNSAIRAYLFERKRADEELTAGELAAEVAKKFKVQVSGGHINHVLRQLALTRPPGRPRKRPTKDESSAPTEPAQAQGGVFFPGGGEATDGSDDDD
jgi:transposase